MRLTRPGRAVLGAAVAVVCGCGSVPHAAPSAPHSTAALPLTAGSTTSLPSPALAALRLAVSARPYHEPGDYAHRNYCGVGATEVLLSAWLPAVPPLEEVARRSHLDPNSGEKGADAVAAVNGYLDPVVRPAVGRSWYRGDHVTDLATVELDLRADLGSTVAEQVFGHTAPVMLQVMTRTLPGWNHWQATHMITVVAADLDHGAPALDTVTYAETPSPLAGYRGPDFQTITVAALWEAMTSFLVHDPSDPVNVIW